MKRRASDKALKCYGMVSAAAMAILITVTIIRALA